MSVAVTSIQCPICSDPLTLHATDQGIVWVCGACRAFGANLAVIRKIAPRQFVKHLWLAALQQGLRSRHLCPSCRQPLQKFGPDVEVSPSCQVCCRCFLIWFDAEGESSPALEVGEDALMRAFRAIRQLADHPPRFAR